LAKSILNFFGTKQIRKQWVVRQKSQKQHQRFKIVVHNDQMNNHDTMMILTAVIVFNVY